MRAGLTSGLVLLSLAGCSLGADKEKARTEPAKGAPSEVAATVEALDKAVQGRDWRTVCDRLFTASARERAGGKDCPRLIGSSAGSLSGSRIELVDIALKKNGAEAKVRSRARGQSALTDTLMLRRVRGGYRIDALR